MNFLEFVKKKNQISECSAILTEAFKSSDVDEAHKLMLELFNKKIHGKTIIDNAPQDTVIDGKNCKSFLFIRTEDYKTFDSFMLNYLVSGKSSAVYSVDIFDKEGTHELLFVSGKAKSNISLYTLGSSIVYFIPIICNIMNEHKYDINKKDAANISKTIFKENRENAKEYWVGAVKFNIIDWSDEVCENMFHIAQDHVSSIDEDGNMVWEEKSELQKARIAKGYEINDARKAGDRKLAGKLQKEYNEMTRAIQGGLTTLAEFNVMIKNNVDVKIVDSPDTQKAEEKFSTKGAKDPQQAFKEMKGYVNMVIQGLQPGVILCGAPGIGKTYRVLQQLYANGYEKDINLHIIKGKCTTRNLYISLYKYQNKGEIILIDDADSLIGPKAPEDTINILKAALDSTSDDDGRLVTYRVSGKILDDDGNELPKSFGYRGSVIVITNYGVGQLDTAVRGRVFTQTLDFTTEQLLDIIRGLMPSIAPEQLHQKAKAKALDYLMELADSGTNMEISIRTFVACAKLFEMGENNEDFSDDDVRSMIKEQMINMALTAKDTKHF